MQETLGLRIREARQRYGMSQAELARRIGISTVAMNQIELGDTDPRASRIAAIAETLHVSADYLLGLDDTGEPRMATVPPPKRQRPRKATPAAN